MAFSIIEMNRGSSLDLLVGEQVNLLTALSLMSLVCALPHPMPLPCLPCTSLALRFA